MYSVFLILRISNTYLLFSIIYFFQINILSISHQISNDDGDWVLLNSESVERHCHQRAPYIEAWTMRANRYLNNEKLLAPVDGGKSETNAAGACNEKQQRAPPATVISTTPKPNREMYVYTSGFEGTDRVRVETYRSGLGFKFQTNRGFPKGRGKTCVYPVSAYGRLWPFVTRSQI